MLQGLTLEPVLVSIFVNVLVRGQRVFTANLQVIQNWKAVSSCINLEYITDAVRGRVYLLFSKHNYLNSSHNGYAYRQQPKEEKDQYKFQLLILQSLNQVLEEFYYWYCQFDLWCKQ